MRFVSKIRLFILLFAVVAVISARTAEPQPVLFTEGNFFVGPEPFPMYVESFIPAKPTHETPIVLIHGMLYNGSGIREYAGRTRGLGKILRLDRVGRPHVVDLPGHGRSPMPENYPTMSLQRAVDDNVALVKKIGRSIFIVHSIGGMIGWKLCETVPNDVAAIIGIAPVPPANMPKGSFPAASAIGQSFVTSGPGPYLPEDRPAWFKLGVAKDAFASATLFPSEAMDEYYASLVPGKSAGDQ